MSEGEVNKLQMLNRILCKQMILIVYQEAEMLACGRMDVSADSRVCERGTVACVGWAGKTYVRQRDRSLAWKLLAMSATRESEALFLRSGEARIIVALLQGMCVTFDTCRRLTLARIGPVGSTLLHGIP